MARTAMRRKAAADDPREDANIRRMKQANRERFVRAMGEIYFDADRWARQFGAPPTLAAIEGVVLARAPVNPVSADQPLREQLRELALDPTYQLK
jgi:hypothetical protein